MLVGVCDFPGTYAFPPHGYGGIERWLWAAAQGAQSAGADVHLLGPRWRDDLGTDWGLYPIRLEEVERGSLQDKELRQAGYDLLIVGHEYPSLPEWRRTAEAMECDVATFQHAPAFRHTPDAFDGHQYRLYCYSPQMMERYASHAPIQQLAVHTGFQEEEPAAVKGRGLVWVGRIDEEKSPHIAVRAAQILKRPIRLIGPVFDHDYLDRHKAPFASDHVEWVGELGGTAKTAAFTGAEVFVYTCARDYIEAGAAVFGESLRAGTPVAALAWVEGTCAQAALCEKSGEVAVVDPAADDEAAARALAEAIEKSESLDHTDVQAIGRQRFDALKHFEALAARR
ncbi:glycosyltransferase involved in cell wall biosynthesis [Nocardiopsis mwathae]|uniref:Glycosyltransferase involved in cell wall biosynthesis n=1 Tax=Nocardiopsis mwathae TaxID=1472723 RepID=A0A7W9YM27_9ACTN|nr:glycosyltransferase [Nocardiopsis mwathae]MBB6174495.1 glycosyltransferase involved in cell wall biosynthesis [Nocardiopsis mwathae]